MYLFCNTRNKETKKTAVLIIVRHLYNNFLRDVKSFQVK